MRSLRALIVDDEPVARAHLRTLLATDPDFEVVGECGNGRDAVAAMRDRAPDLVFLDIQMPELDGFGVVRAVGIDRMPTVVFITAHDDHALEAFEVYAFDYLLKPVDRARFHETLRRAKAQIWRGRPADIGEQLGALLEYLSTQQQQLGRLAIKVDGRVLFLNTDEIDWIEAVDDHARIHVAHQVHLVRDTLTRLEARLASAKFLRIHRSTIVNVNRIKEIQPWFQGDYVVILTDGTRLTSGRSYRERLQSFLRRSS
jgi:two-component system, LytTR family, response regulator